MDTSTRLHIEALKIVLKDSKLGLKALAELEAELAKHQWISVEDRLPEHAEEVCLWVAHGFCEIGFVDFELDDSGQLIPENFMFYKTGNEEHPIEYEITHWMLIQEPTDD